MKKLTIFYQIACPYCICAKHAVKKLQKDNSEYASVAVEWIDENTVKDFPDWCDYYYVPTIFMEKEKIYEAKPGDSSDIIMSNVQMAFDSALKNSI